MDRSHVAPIVIGFAPSTNPSAFAPSGEQVAVSGTQGTLPTDARPSPASPLSRNTSRGASSSQGLLSLQLSLQHESRGYDEYEDGSDFDSEDYSDTEGEFALRGGGPSRRPACYGDVDLEAAFGGSTGQRLDRSQSQPISIPTTMWIKDPAASTACCLLQRERAIRRQQYEQSEAYAKQQYELQLRHQYQLQQQQQLHAQQHYLYAPGQC